MKELVVILLLMVQAIIYEQSDNELICPTLGMWKSFIYIFLKYHSIDDLLLL